MILGDEILTSYGLGQEALARVVAIGLNLVVEDIDRNFYDWAKRENIITDQTVVVEWIGQNPLAHDDSHYAPVGNYMTLSSLCCEKFIRRCNS